MTRRLWITLCLTFLLGIFSLSIGQTRAEGSVIDQENAVGNRGYLTISNHPGIAQSFTPTVGTVDKVSVYLKDMVAGTWLGMEILDSNQNSLTSFGSRMSGGTNWETNTLSPLAVTPGQTYFVRLSTSAASVQWAYNNGNTYAGGSAWYGTGFKPDEDFWFRTYYTSTSAFEEDGDVNTQISGTTDTSTAMSTATSASIVKPTNLTAKFIDNQNQRGVNLEWKTSTSTDITGYLVFRSDKSATGYAKVGQTLKNNLSFLDTNIAASKTYYYQVRAYKDSEQSASSNTASVTTPNDIGPAKPANLKITENGKDYLVLGWDKNTEANLSGYTITIYKDEQQIATTDLAKEVASYKFSNLSEATNYQVKLVAKDSAGKFSAPAWVFGATLPGATAKYVINKWVGLLAGVALALVVILIVTIIKRRRIHKIKRTI